MLILLCLTLAILIFRLFVLTRESGELQKRLTAGLEIIESQRDVEKSLKKSLSTLQSDHNKAIAINQIQAKLLEKYKPITDLDAELETLSKRHMKLECELKNMSEVYEAAKNEVSSFTERADLLSAGFYTPMYEFADSGHYKEKLESIRATQKTLIRNKNAIKCETSWELNGSTAEGRKMVEKTIKLALNAFNVQCDNIILKVTYRNIHSSLERMNKVRENIDKLLQDGKCFVAQPFFDLKVKELNLAHEYEEKSAQEREERRRIQEQMREEEKVRLEIEKVKQEAETEESRFKESLAAAYKEFDHQSAKEREESNKLISKLKEQLAEATERKERAIAQASLTKRGHVYIISNIGSFGDDVYKIGLTRRLEPMDRVRELGDAAVPFTFDVHAMIFSEDAPDLEKRLHEAFTHKRVNLINGRKEYFSTSIEEIEQKCKEFGAVIEFVKVPDAKEYRQTLQLIEARRVDPIPVPVEPSAMDNIREILRKKTKESSAA